MNARDRDFEQLQGHWLLARLGKKVLRPGGRKMTEWILDRARLTDARVVELAPGLGITATEILNRAPGDYVGIDEDPDAAKTTGKVVGHKGRVTEGKAQATGLGDDSADAVVGEAMLTMQGDKGKAAILDEVRRILVPGGRYAIHELALTPDDLDAATKDEIRIAMSKAIRVNARPLTVAEWRNLLEEHGFEVEHVRIAEMGLLKPSQMIEDEGISGVARIAGNMIKHPAARKRVLGMRSVFVENDDALASIGIVARLRDTADSADAADATGTVSNASESGREASPAVRRGPEIEFLDDDQQAELTADPEALSLHDVVAAAPPAKDGDGPAVKRLQTADGVNIIAMRFRSGQALPDHRAAHPIMVQCIEGQVRFTVGDRTEVLTPGTVAHLPTMVPHRVDADEDSVFLLSMLT